MTAHPLLNAYPPTVQNKKAGMEKGSRVGCLGAKLLSGLGFQGGRILCSWLSVGGRMGGG